MTEYNLSNKTNKDGSQIILFKNNKRNEVFLVKRTDIPIWVETGGGIEHGESPKKAAMREAFEETGFRIKIIKHLVNYKVVNKKRNEIRKEYLFEGRVIAGKYKPEFPRNIGKWFSIDKLPINTSITTRKRITDAIKHHNISRPINLTMKQGAILECKTITFLLRHLNRLNQATLKELF